MTARYVWVWVSLLSVFACVVLGELERDKLRAYQACVASTERIAKLAIESRVDRLISLPSCTVR